MNQNNYFTMEQLDKIKEQCELLGPEKMREVENEWPELIAKVRAELENGTPTDSIEVKQLAKRWRELFEMFSGGDPEIIKASERFHAENPNNSLANGLDKELYQYTRKAMSDI